MKLKKFIEKNTSDFEVKNGKVEKCFLIPEVYMPALNAIDPFDFEERKDYLRLRRGCIHLISYYGHLRFFDYVSLNTKVLVKLHLYASYCYLRDLGIIITDGSYKTGEKNLHSLLNPYWRTNNKISLKTLQALKDILNEGDIVALPVRLEYARAKTNKEVVVDRTDVEEIYDNWLSGLYFDEDAITAEMQKMGYLYDYRHLMRFKMANRETFLADWVKEEDKGRVKAWLFSIATFEQYKSISADAKEVGRIYSILTNLKKEFRACLKHKSGDYIEVDLKNSQPTLLINELMARGLPVEQEVIEATYEGKFYELLMGVIDWEVEEKKTHRTITIPSPTGDVKKTVAIDDLDITCEKSKRQRAKAVCMSFITSSTHKVATSESGSKTVYNEFEGMSITKRMREAYPNFVESMVEFKNEVGSPALYLQDLETRLLVPIALEAEGITLHDAVIVMPEFEEQVLSNIKSAIENARVEVNTFGVNKN